MYIYNFKIRKKIDICFVLTFLDYVPHMWCRTSVLYCHVPVWGKGCDTHKLVRFQSSANSQWKLKSSVLIGFLYSYLCLTFWGADLKALSYIAGYKINAARLELGLCYSCFGLCPSYTTHGSAPDLMWFQLTAFLEANW